MAVYRPFQLLPGGLAAVGDTSEHAVGTGPRTREEDGAAVADAQPGGPGEAPASRVAPAGDEEKATPRLSAVQ